MPYKFNPFTGSLDTVNKNEYTEFVYNSSGSQSKNRYNNWSDLVTELSNVEGEKKIIFEQNETLPAGTYTLENTIWLGNGFPAAAGGVTVTLPTGFVLNEVPSLRIDNFLVVTTTSINPIMTVTGLHNCLTYNNSGISATNKEFYKVETGALLIYVLFGGCVTGNAGYEVINLNAADATMSLAFLGGGNGITDNTYRGSGIVLLQGFDAAPQDNATFDWLYNTQANFSGTLVENLQNRADYISYDNTTSGLTADRVQAAIDELETAKQDALGFTPENVANKDTDGTLAANSDTKYASQKATKTYADTKIAKSQLAAKGDLITATASSTPSTLTVGTNDYFLIADSTASDGIKWGENYHLPLQYKANDYILLSRNIGVGNTQGALGSTTSNSNGLAKYVPFYINKTITIDQLVMTVGTANAGASAVLRLGIYNNSNARPGTVLLDGGTQSINAAGVKTFSFANQTINPGYYWAVAVFQGLDTAGTNPTLQQTSNGSACQETAVANSNNYIATFITTGVTGAFAATPTITISRQINPSYPNIYARNV